MKVHGTRDAAGLPTQGPFIAAYLEREDQRLPDQIIGNTATTISFLRRLPSSTGLVAEIAGT